MNISDYSHGLVGDFTLDETDYCNGSGSVVEFSQITGEGDEQLPRKKSGNFDNRVYQNEYHKAMKTKLLSFNPSSSEDMRMWGYLMTKDNSTKYIKGLIQTDMDRRSGKMKYRVKAEYFDLWGNDVDEGTVITQDELERLSGEWEKPVDELAEQLVPLEFNVGLANRYCIFDSADLETVSDVLDFIPGRGGHYVAHITNNESGKTITVSYDDDTGTYCTYDCHAELIPLTEKDIRQMIG